VKVKKKRGKKRRVKKLKQIKQVKVRYSDMPPLMVRMCGGCEFWEREDKIDLC